MATEWVNITESGFYGNYAGYIRFANQLFKLDGAIGSTTSNAMSIFRISENTHYRVTMQMRNRFRLGCLANITTGQTVTNYVFDPLDANDTTDQNGSVRSLEITSGAGQTYLVIGAWSSGASETIQNTLNSIVVEEAHTTFTVQFVNWDGTVLKNEAVSYGESSTPPSNPAREGYTFTGWLGNYTNVTADTTVTAQYVEGSLYTVQFVDWNGSVLKTEEIGTGGSATPPTDPMRTGYIFTGWNGSYTDIQSDTTITAAYTVITYTIQFVDWNGTVLKSETVGYGSDTIPPAIPIRNGYLFDHWSDVYTNITADTTITAVYVIDPSTLTGVEISTPPTKTAYLQGEPFDDTGLVVSAVYSIVGTVPISEYTLSGFDTGAFGVCTVTAIYGGYTASFDLSFAKNVVTEECGYPTLANVVATLDLYTGVITVTGTGVMKDSESQSGGLFQAYRSSIRSVVISEGITKIGSGLFKYNSVLSSVSFPNSLTAIGAAAFYSTGLTSVTLPSSVSVIGSNVFEYCRSLTTAELNTSAVSVGICLFDGCTLLTEVILPPALTAVSSSMFKDCTSLTSVSIPDTVTTLGYKAFSGCTSLSSVSVPDSLTNIDGYVFQNTEVTSISLPDTIQTISSTAFSGSLITSIYLDVEYGSVSGSPWGAVGATVSWCTAPIDFLEIVTPPTKTAYLYGEAFDTAGMAVRVHYTDATTSDVSNFTIEGYNGRTLGEQTLYAVYHTARCGFTVTVSNYATRIVITTPPAKTEYSVGETLDVTGLVVSKVYANAATELVSDYTLSSIDYAITGLQSITITSDGFSVSFTITCHFPVTLESLLDNTNGMTAIRNNSKNDNITDELTGVDWFTFNNTVADKVYVNGNNYIGFSTKSEHLGVCRNDGAVYYIYRLEGALTNGHRFLKIRVDGTARYNQYTDVYRLVYELYLFDDNSMFLNVIHTPIIASYTGIIRLICGDTTQTLTTTADTQSKFSFYATDNTGTSWMAEPACHIYLGEALSLTPPVKTEYLLDEAFDDTGMAVFMQTVAYGNVPITGYTLSGFDSLTVGTKTISVTYRTLSTSFTISVGGLLVEEIGSPNLPDVIASLNLLSGELTLTGTGETVNYSDTQLFGENSASVCSITVAEGITGIGDFLFSGYPQCTVSLPSTLTVIGNRSFQDCVLSDILLPSSLTSLGEGAFSGCTALTTIDIPESVSAISTDTFSGCTSLSAITIDNVRNAFTGAPWGAENATVVWLRGGLYVYWLDWDETELKCELVEYEADGTPPAEPTRTGFLFSGWDVSYHRIVSDTSIHAMYNIKSIFLVEFRDYDGRVLKSDYLTFGAAAVPPAEPLRDGYTFTGWSIDYGYISADTVIIATYSERTDEYSVTFKSWDNTILKEETVAYGHSATAPVPPERDGYRFLSWSTSFGFITSNTVTAAQYRLCRVKTAAEVFNGEAKVGEIHKVTDCSVSQKLNGECTLSLSTLAALSDFVRLQYKLEINNLIFDITGIEKHIQNGIYQITVIGEHVSYILNNDEYKLNSFDFTGTPSVCLARLLEGTPFSVGMVDFSASVTLRINKAGTTRRDAVMQLLALCGGEIEYIGYSIGIRSHVGNPERIYLMDTLNVKDLALTLDSRSNAESYSIQLFKRVSLSVGDEVNITFTPLGINTDKRITEIMYNPFNAYHIDVSLGSYRPTLSDSLYTIAQQTNTNTLDTGNLDSRLTGMEHALETLSNSANSGGFKVRSVLSLPDNPDGNTVYLIQGEVTVV